MFLTKSTGAFVSFSPFDFHMMSKPFEKFCKSDDVDA